MVMRPTVPMAAAPRARSAVAAEADHVQRPQTQALDDIEAQGSESENRR